MEVSRWKQEVAARLAEAFGQKADRDAAEAIQRKKVRQPAHMATEPDAANTASGLRPAATTRR